MKIEDMMNLELYHHGIRGQRWGVRRYQNYDGTRIKGDYRILKEGTTVQKIAGNEIKNLDNRHFYVSYTPYDNKEYKNYPEAVVDAQDFYYQNKYKTIKELKIPNDEIVVDRILNSGLLNKAYNKLVSENYDFSTNEYDQYFKSDLMDFNKLGTLSDKGNKRLASIGFRALYRAGYTSEFVSLLAKEGYDAVKDLENAPLWNTVDNYWYQDPLIIFNPSETLKFEGSTKYILES